tara:strand:+ start:90 stop:365 length:276 start_codon:yes stop_codon:yes gene_type:complete
MRQQTNLALPRQRQKQKNNAEKKKGKKKFILVNLDDCAYSQPVRRIIKINNQNKFFLPSHNVTEGKVWAIFLTFYLDFACRRSLTTFVKYV